MSKIIHDRTTKYIEHKTNILIDRVYLAIQDKIFDAENYDEFEIDSDNNIYVTYSLKRDENIISEAHDLIADQIKRKYRKKLEAKLEEESYFVEYDDLDIHVYFEKPLKADNDDSSEISSIKKSKKKNILKYKKVNKPTLLTGSEDSGEFDFGDDNN
jgi:hypothetical protein